MKSKSIPDDFAWYGYDSLSNLYHFPLLFPGKLGELFDTIDGPIADIGGADGDLTFLLDREGHDAHLIDHPESNWNGMTGAYRLRELLESSAGIHEVNLDTQFALPHERYELVIFLAILYHLKNPFFVMERLARHARRMILSTRIARQTRSGGVTFGDEPLAYLLGPAECNNDASNFWIFSLAGLERLAARTGWEIRVVYTVGDEEASNSRDADHDERAWMMLESGLID